MLKREKTKFFVVGTAVFAIAALLIVMRIVINLIYQPLTSLVKTEWGADLLVDALFSVPVQILVCFLMPLLIYKFGLKKSFKGVFDYSNYHKTKPINLLLAFILGLAAFFASAGISSIWLTVLESFGYTYTSSATAQPETFNVGVLFANLFLTAVLPAICEEFANRGAFLTVLREHFSTAGTILLCGLGFGLFHANIEQLFYTACFGMVMSFVVIKTGSIYPAMIIHFMNNAMSVAISTFDTYADESIRGGFDLVFNGGGFLILFIISVPVIIALLYVIARVNKDTAGASQPPLMPMRRFVYVDPDTGVMIPDSEGVEDVFGQPAFDPRDIDPFDSEKPQTGGYNGGYKGYEDIDPFDGKPVVKRPRKVYINSFVVNKRRHFIRKDGEWKVVDGTGLEKYEKIFWIGGIVIATAATLFSLIWGFMM